MNPVGLPSMWIRVSAVREAGVSSAGFWAVSEGRSPTQNRLTPSLHRWPRPVRLGFRVPCKPVGGQGVEAPLAVVEKVEEAFLPAVDQVEAEPAERKWRSFLRNGFFFRGSAQIPTSG